MKMKYSKIAASLLFSASVSQAAVVYDGFTGYTNNGTLSGENGGSGWTSSWSANNNGFVVDSTATLAYGGLTTSAGLVQDTSASANQLYFRESSMAAVADGGTRWFSTLMRVDSLNSTVTANQLILSSGLTSNGQTAFQNGTLAGFAILGNAAGNGYDITSALSNSSYGARVALPSFGSTMFVVGKYTFNTGGNETMDLWINPATSTLGGANLTNPQATSSANTNGAANQFRFTATGGTTGNHFTGALDEVRFGDTYADVAPVPEPSSLALIGLGGLAFISRRRRQPV